METKITEEQLDKIFELNPLGDRYLCKYDINNIIGKIDTKGKPIDFNYLYNKYKEYIVYYNTRYGNTEERFVPKTDKLRTISQFIEQQMYIQEFRSGTKLDPRTSYIFGDITKIKEQYEQTFNKNEKNYDKS